MALTAAQAEIQSAVFKALAHPVRLLLVDALRGRDLGFSALLARFDLDKSTISKHLLVLVEKNAPEKIHATPVLPVRFVPFVRQI